MDTIFALATPRGKSGVAIVRLSGPASHDSVAALAGDVPSPRRASLRRLRDAAGEDLDEAVVLTFAEGASFTGETSAELHLHGSHAVIEAVLATLSAQPGLRIAEPGEFTRRALENETLDLAQIEGLADLIDAETEAQRKQAFRVLSGELGRRSEDWRSRLIRAAALLEATIDFADEDVPEDVSPEVIELIKTVRVALAHEIKGSVMSERIRTGFEVAIVGKPNTGKSTLLNALSGREAAITSEIAGTTRDVIEVRMDLAGLAVTLLDTAGLREASDSIEAVGIARARERAAQADLRVVLLEDDVDRPDIPLETGDIVLRGKADLIDGNAGAAVSGKTGQGVDALIARVSDVLAQRSSGAGLAIRARHREAMTRAITSLESALNEVETGPDRTELAAEEVRTAIRALESLLGRVDVEDLLDEIFASFCLGK